MIRVALGARRDIVAREKDWMREESEFKTLAARAGLLFDD